MAKVEKYTFMEFMQLAFSENKVPSSKRVIGGLLIFGVIITVIICAILGYVTFLPEILNTCLITGGALLGLSSITSIWKKDGSSTVKAADKQDESES